MWSEPGYADKPGDPDYADSPEPCAGRRRRGRSAHARTRRAALERAYPAKQLTRAEFDELDAKWRAANGVGPSERGRQTEWELYRAGWNRTRCKGQDALTTNSQCAAALANRGRSRCSRTIQRTHRRLKAKGLIDAEHVHRGRSAPGFKDLLRVRLLPKFVTPPTAATAKSPKRDLASVALQHSSEKPNRRSRKRQRPAQPAGIVPPHGGRTWNQLRRERGATKVAGLRLPCIDEACDGQMKVDPYTIDDSVWTVDCEICGSTAGIPPRGQERLCMAATTSPGSR